MAVPLISVICTTYKRPKMLKRAVKSVLKQTFKNWELIIVDDFSNDETKKICESFVREDSRIRYFELQSNNGVHSFGKNVGIKEARANLIAYLDDDNAYRRDHLQVLYKYLGNNDIVYGDRLLIDESGYVAKMFGKQKQSVGVRSDFSAQLLSEMNFIDTSDILVKKDKIVEIGGWDESLPKFADWNFFVRLAKSGARFKRIPIIITDYYVHSGCNSFKHPQPRNPNTGKEMPTFKPDDCYVWPNKTLFGEKPKSKVAVFTLTMSRLEYTQIMYDSMVKNAGYEFDWFVVDNGSTDGTPDWVGEKAKFLVRNEYNLGISKGSNQALDKIGDEYDIIIKVDNDCEFETENWLKDTVDLIEKQHGLVLSPRVEGLRDSPGGVPRTQYFYIGDELLGIVPHVGGICVAAHKSAYDKFRWEDNDFLHGEQDYVFSQHCKRIGKMLCYYEKHIVEHMFTTEGQLKRSPEYFENRSKLKTTKYESFANNTK